MQTSQLLLEGVEIMLFGMGSVFVFLVLLIICIRLMSYFTDRFVEEPEVTPARVQTAAAVEADADTLAAIKAAIHLHRARRG